MCCESAAGLKQYVRVFHEYNDEGFGPSNVTIAVTFPLR